MKKLFILYLSLILAIMLTLTGCGGNPPDTADGGSVISAITDNTQSADTENPAQSHDENVSSTSESTAESQNTTGGRKTEASKSTGTTSKPSTSNNSSQPPTTTESTSSPPTPESSTDNTVRPVNAKATDAKDIAEKILKYINQYRVAQGAGEANNLSGLTQVAQYRSNQLITNYNHDTADERAAATALKYGKHVVIEETRWDPVTATEIKTGNILDYYDACCGEAIGRSGGNASVDEIAQRMAKGFKDSAKHWDYVGAARNKYLSIGASYGNGQWYICILTSETDTYG